jgi:hypothetical protein
MKNPNAASLSILATGLLLAGCANSSTGTSSSTSGSEIAVSTVSGAMQSGGSSSAALNSPRVKQSFYARLMPEIFPAAQAATWSCTGTGFTTTYSGPGTYLYEPLSCTVTYADGKSFGAVWNGDWNYVYGASCSASGGEFRPDTQSAGCVITRTSPTGGLTRTLSDSSGDSYAIDHDTTSANTGFDSTEYPTTSAGITLTCGGSGCATSRTMVINGSHLTGTITPSGGSPLEFWDHTVSSGTNGLSITGSGVSRSVSGTVVVQHNLAKYVSLSTFSSVTYGNPLCCFPTSGTISTSYASGPLLNSGETLTFSSSCGEATLTQNGTSSPITLIHCI